MTAGTAPEVSGGTRNAKGGQKWNFSLALSYSSIFEIHGVSPGGSEWLLGQLRRCPGTRGMHGGSHKWNLSFAFSYSSIFEVQGGWPGASE